MIRSATDNTLLTYDMRTEPGPLQASPLEGDVAYGALTIVVSNTTKAAIYCNQIQFSFKPGNLPQNLTNVISGILTNASPSDNWKISETGSCVFTATPIRPNDNKITTIGLVFEIFHIVVNESPGTFTFSITETSSLDDTNFEKRSADFKVTKFPFGFFFTNFIPDHTQVNNGEAVTLSWDGSDDASYFMIYSGLPQPIDVTEIRTWTSPPLLMDTTFLLEARLSSQGETVSEYLSTTVIVANPSITAKQLIVQTTSDLLGAVTVGTDAAPAPVTVKGSLSASSELDVTSTSRLHGGAEVSGLLNAANVTVDQELRVAGPSTMTGQLNANAGAKVDGGEFRATTKSMLADTTIDGMLEVTRSTLLAQATLSGQLKTNNFVNMFRASVSLTAPGVYVGTTDGFVIGYVYYDSKATDKCLGWIGASCNGMTVQATGGNTVYRTGTWSDDYCNNQQSLFLPTPAGKSFSISQWVGDGNPKMSFWWAPVGVGTLQNSDDELPALSPPQIAKSETRDPKKLRRERLIKLLAELLDDEDL